MLVYPCAAALYPSVSYNCDSVNLVAPPHANHNFGVFVVVHAKVECDNLLWEDAEFSERNAVFVFRAVE